MPRRELAVRAWPAPSPAAGTSARRRPAGWYERQGVGGSRGRGRRRRNRPPRRPWTGAAAVESWAAARAGAARRARESKGEARDRSEQTRERWRERVGIEPTGAAEGVSVAVLKTGQTTRPDPPPPEQPRYDRLLRRTADRSLTAITSISTRAPRGSAATATVERAGRWSPKARGIDLVHRGEVRHVDQEDRGLEHAGQVEPAASRMARRFGSTRSVCSAIPPATISPVDGSSAIWPAVKRKPPARVAWL